MSEYLFAYGTLRPGLAPDSMAQVVESLEVLGSGSIDGILYDLGEFPGVVLEAGRGGKVSGVVYRLPADAKIMLQLDAYEGYEPDCPEASLFVRVLHPVEMTEGATIPCWIYAYNRPVDGAMAVPQWPNEAGKKTGTCRETALSNSALAPREAARSLPEVS